MWVLMAITIGASLRGVVGMIIAVPLAATCYQMLRDNIEKNKRFKKADFIMNCTPKVRQKI